MQTQEEHSFLTSLKVLDIFTSFCRMPSAFIMFYRTLTETSAQQYFSNLFELYQAAYRTLPKHAQRLAS